MTGKSVNVKVAVRCRPLSKTETQKGAQEIIRVEDHKTVYVDGPNPKNFTFDHSYDSHSTQAQLYSDIAKPLVDQAFQGYKYVASS